MYLLKQELLLCLAEISLDRRIPSRKTELYLNLIEQMFRAKGHLDLFYVEIESWKLYEKF